MNIDEANKIKDKILQNEEYGGIAKRVENILNHKEFIEQDKNSADNMRYLYDILRDIGYLRMRNYGLNENLMNEIKELFCLKLPHSENNAPTLFFFEDLFDEIDLYQNLMQNIEPAPNAGEKPEKEEIWESRWRDLKDCGLKLVFSGFDITAVMLGSELLLADTLVSDEWKQSWKTFSDNANKYLKKLYELNEQMPSIAERIHQELEEYNMPDGEFFKFASDIAAIRKSCPKDNHFRYILKPEEVNELYQKAKHIFQEYPPAARIYFFKNALAEETLKHFIQKGCIELLTNDETLQTNSKWSLQGTLDGEPAKKTISVVPMLYAGKKEIYSVHMLGPRVSGWGIRSDRLRSLLFNDEKYKGAFFCSWKEYPTEEILVRFDRFIPKAKFIELVKGAKDFIRLNIDTVLKEEDLREKALQQATIAVLGLPPKPETVPIKIPEIFKQIFQAPERILSNAINWLNKLVDFPNILTPIPAPAETQGGPSSKPPEYQTTYEPILSWEDIVFLDPKSANENITNLVYYAEYKKWYFIRFFIDKKNKLINGLSDPEKIYTDEGVYVEKKKIPQDTECIYFAVGPKDQLEAVKTFLSQKNENTGINKEKIQGIFWVIYGPGKK